MTYGLRFEYEEKNKIAVLRIDGRLDAASSPILEKKLESLIQESQLKIALDFSKVEYLSSAGMRLLLSMTKKLKVKKGNLAIFYMNEDLMEIIKMAGFERILHIFDNETKALAFF